MVRTYRAHKGKPRRGTYRKILGGSIESVEKLIKETPIKDVHIINPESRFVVATYWWGRNNMNRNLQYPCPEDIMDIARREVISEIGRTKGFPKNIVDIGRKIAETEKRRNLTKNEANIFELLKKEWKEWVKSVLAKEENKTKIAEKVKEVEARELAKPGARQKRSFPDMIKEWEGKCEEAKVNYIALNTEFPREDYQNGINGKPLFIKQVLDAVAPRAVVYIDGDMWMHKYPDIFDIENVDFMARGWNMDPRTKEKALRKPFYDPYTFETSGGTMYFGNTAIARKLLDDWAAASSKPEQAGKADDRILSQVFTTQSLVIGTNIINLPLEYLWLTDIYKPFLKDASSPASIEDAYIEHPYCLTGEERATDQGASSNRTPPNYDEEVIENINYKRPTELFYEYIFFDGDQKKRDGFGRYLKYMKTAKSGFTGQLMIDIVDFADKYGKYNDVATKNLEGLTLTSEGGSVSLPQETSVRDILTALYAGKDVEIGGSIDEKSSDDEFVAHDASTKQDGIDMYTRKIVVDAKKPMFLSGKSHVIRNLLAMCGTLEDINKHVSGNYMFMSRIRWNLIKGAAPKEEKEKEKTSMIVPPTKEGVDFKRVVHQIWFGGDIPEWKKSMFDVNKAICDEHGFKYSLWKNEDRNDENFPQTLAYQNSAIEAGKKTGQKRWAQVADLARLEIVYNSSGIYIDSLFEISPAFLKAIVDAINAGAQFIGCNEDPCDPPLDCKNAKGEMYLTNSFFAATRANPIFKRLLSPEKLDAIDMTNAEINHTTGPYFLRSGITGEDKVFLFDSGQIYQFRQQESPYQEAKPNRFLFKEKVPGSVKVKDDMYYLPGGLNVLQQEFVVEKKGPLAIYHSGLGGTWSL